jgi:N-methylhydantoinase B
VYELELLEEEADAFIFAERARFGPQGVAGGSPGALNRFRYEQDDGFHVPPLASKMVGIRLRRGQRVRLESPGGGGYGPALERDPAAVARDVRLGYVSVEAARRDYGVVVAAEGAVDAPATRAERSSR